MATRAETLISQHARSAIEILEAARKEVNTQKLPPPPVPPHVRSLFGRLWASRKLVKRLESRINKAGWSIYYSQGRPSLNNDLRRAKLRDPLTAAIERVKRLQRDANLAVLGMKPEQAAPIVRKFVKDIHRA